MIAKSSAVNSQVRRRSGINEKKGSSLKFSIKNNFETVTHAANFFSQIDKKIPQSYYIFSFIEPYASKLGQKMKNIFWEGESSFWTVLTFHMWIVLSRVDHKCDHLMAGAKNIFGALQFCLYFWVCFDLLRVESLEWRRRPVTRADSLRCSGDNSKHCGVVFLWRGVFWLFETSPGATSRTRYAAATADQGIAE